MSDGNSTISCIKVHVPYVQNTLALLDRALANTRDEAR
jgi:hypothetical protein